MSRRKSTKSKRYQPVDHEKFYQTRRMGCFSKEEAACLLHVTECTINQWESGQSPIPYAAYKLLRIFSGYDLPGKTWEGWALHSGALWSPANRRFNPVDLAYLENKLSMAQLWQKHYDERATWRVMQALQDQRRLGKPVLYLVK